MTILDTLFRSHSIKKLLRNAKTVHIERNFLPKEEIKTCIVMVKAGDFAVDKLKLKAPYISFEKVAFLPNDFNGELRSDIIYVKNTDVKFGGKILNEAFTKVTSKSYDALIDLSDGSADLEKYFLKATHASFRIGRHPHESYDLVLDATKDENEFIDNIFDLLSKLKKF